MVLTIGCTLLSAPAPAWAAATPVNYPGDAASTRFKGYAFDTCTAPPLKTMRAWKRSRYGGVGVYIGGPLRACSQRNLNRGWVREATSMGWRLIPIYVGLQAPCRRHPERFLISTKYASRQGEQAAAGAVRRAAGLGMIPGSALYLDVEAYPDGRPKCRSAVRRYISGWTRALHRRGYLSGVYASAASGAKHLAESYRFGRIARPDALWIAQWDASSSLRHWPTVPDALWQSGQRGKQFHGPHRARYGGHTLTVDSNSFDAPVASVARRHRVAGETRIKARTGPSMKKKVVTSFRPHALVQTVCQVPIGRPGRVKVWVKLTNGTYVKGWHLRPNPASPRIGLPRCVYPYQVTAPDKVAKRTGPGTSFRKTGHIYTGGLVRIACQARGSSIFGDPVWNRLYDGTWVADHYVATNSRQGFSRPIPRC